MAKLYRPYIPLPVRVKVAERQFRKLFPDEFGYLVTGKQTSGNRLKVLLPHIGAGLGCEVKDLRLDHDPALCNRQQFRNGLGEVVRYVPDANDPEHLIYRTKADHDIKTRIRGQRGQLSDLALLRREKRRQKSSKPKKKWPSRPFPKANRGFRK